MGRPRYPHTLALTRYTFNTIFTAVGTWNIRAKVRNAGANGEDCPASICGAPKRRQSS